MMSSKNSEEFSKDSPLSYLRTGGSLKLLCFSAQETAVQSASDLSGMCVGYFYDPVEFPWTSCLRCCKEPV